MHDVFPPPANFAYAVGIMNGASSENEPDRANKSLFLRWTDAIVAIILTLQGVPEYQILEMID